MCGSPPCASATAEDGVESAAAAGPAEGAADATGAEDEDEVAQIGELLAEIEARTREVQQAMAQARRDVVYDIPGSRTGTNFLVEAAQAHCAA